MNIKVLSIVGNILFVLNVVVGILLLHWAVVLVFALAHAAVRHFYVQAEMQAAQGKDEELNKIQAAMPMVRHVATFVSSFVVAAILYGVGYGARYLVNLVM